MVDGILSPNWQYIPLMYHLYIYIDIAFWGVKNATYHLLPEPERTIDKVGELSTPRALA